MTIRELIVSFKLKADTKAVKRFGEALEGAKAAARDLVAWGAKLAAVYLAVGGALAVTSARAADFAEEVMRSASAFGISTAQYQEQLFAMQALGASADDLADMYSTLAERSIQAIEGSKNYTREFKRMGISIDELKGKKPGELFNLYIQKASEMTDESQRAAAAAALLGDDLGRRVARGLGVAGSSFNDYVAIIRKVGGVFSDEQLERAQKAQIQFRLLGATFSTLKKKIGLELAPVFGAFAEKIFRLVSRNTGAINEFVTRLRDGVQRELLRLELIAKKVDKVVQDSFGGWISLSEKLGVALGGAVAVITGVKIAAVISALIPLFKALSIPVIVAGAKIIALAAIIAALLLTFEDLWVEINGGDSLIGKLIERFRGMGNILGTAVAMVLEFTVENFRGLADEFRALADDHGPKLMGILRFLANVIIGVLGAAFIFFINQLIFVARWVVLLLRIIGGMVDAFLWLAGIISDVVVGAVNEGADAILWLIETIEEGLRAIPELFSQIKGMIPGFDVEVKDNRIGDRMNNSALAQPNAFAGAVSTAGVRGGGGGGRSIEQRNEFTATINANSKAEGREAARGFKQEVEGGGFYDSLKSTFEPGEI